MKKLLAIVFILFTTSALAQSSRQIQSSDVTGALGYTPLRSIGGMTGPAISCGTGLSCSANTITNSSATGGTSGQIQYNNFGVLGGFTATGDATVNTTTGALTLATVNANVGSFGSATNCVSFTTNAKGLITAASAVTCTPAISSVAGLGTGVGTFLGTPSSANLRAAMTDETGTGLLYFQGGDIGTPSAGVGTNITNLSATNISTGSLNPARLNPTPTSNVLGANVLLNNIANFFDGPSIAQGTTGTWWASGTVTVTDTAGAASIICKLWDGITVIASTLHTVSAVSQRSSASLSGFIASPAGNIRISCQDGTSTSGLIYSNTSGVGKDSTISAFRIQ